MQNSRPVIFIKYMQIISPPYTTSIKIHIICEKVTIISLEFITKFFQRQKKLKINNNLMNKIIVLNVSN